MGVRGEEIKERRQSRERMEITTVLSSTSVIQKEILLGSELGTETDNIRRCEVCERRNEAASTNWKDLMRIRYCS